MKQGTTTKEVQELKEAIENLGHSQRKNGISLLRQIATVVISTILLNIGATYLTVRSNTARIDKLEDMYSSHQEMKEFIAALQIQNMYVRDDVNTNKQDIKEANLKIDNFITKYYTSTTRGETKKGK